MQGVYVNGRRPKTKKAIKDALANGDRVELEATSLFGDEYGGPVEGMPEGKGIHFVGPDPHTKRTFYGTITRKGDKVTVK